MEIICGWESEWGITVGGKQRVLEVVWEYQQRVLQVSFGVSASPVVGMADDFEEWFRYGDVLKSINLFYYILRY